MSVKILLLIISMLIQKYAMEKDNLYWFPPNNPVYYKPKIDTPYDCTCGKSKYMTKSLSRIFGGKDAERNRHSDQIT